MSTETTGTPARGDLLLNQVVALEKGAKTAAKTAQTEAYQKLGKSEVPLSGLLRTYQPLVDGDVVLPSEETHVQIRVEDIVNDLGQLTARLLNVTATKDVGNTQARADLVVDGEVIVADVPPTFLLTLEKELGDWRTMILSLPELDLAERWSADADVNAYRSEPRQTIRTVKTPKPIVLAPATDRHPAQVQMITEDVPLGTWTNVKFSGKIPGQRKAELLASVDKLIAAAKIAREAANTTRVADVNAGTAIASYLLR